MKLNMNNKSAFMAASSGGIGLGIASFQSMEGVRLVVSGGPKSRRMRPGQAGGRGR